MSTARRRLVATLLPVVAVLMSCGPASPPGVLRTATEDFEFRISADVMPPRAIERITYTVVVRDRKTQEPIANGEGRIFATNSDRKTVYNGFTYGPEVGTYRATITFVTAGEWAMGIQFRRDSTQALQRTHDWRQQVKNEVAPGPP
ncbi:MAG: hypothetical protein ACKVS7_16040 [Gemmatimonadaceae bacterium]